MQERISLNSSSLQKKFDNIYQDFFINNDMVLSGCFALAWTPSGIGQHDMLNYIKQKLPTKCYIGINFLKKDEISFNDIGFYNLNKEEFDYFPFEEINNQKDKLVEFIYELKNKLGLESGIEISILSENMRGHGVGFSGTISAVLTVGLWILSGKLSVSDLENYLEFIESPEFNNIHLESFRQDYISRFGKTLGENSLFTLINTEKPIFYMNQKISKKEVSDLDNKGVRFFDIVEKFNDNDINGNLNTDIPLDYAIIFSGKRSKTEQVEYYRDLDLIKGKKTKKFIIDKIDFLKDIDNDYGLKDFLVEEDMESWYNKMILTLNAQVLYYFDKIINEGYEISNINNFINQINLYRYAISLVENQNPFADDFINTFNSYKSLNDEKLGIMPMYSGKFGGGYLIVMKENYSREALYKTIFSLRDKYKNCTIEYASWLDGNSSDGVKLEQYASAGFYSKYFDENKLLLETNKGRKVLGERDDLMGEIKEGIVVDQIARKIYVNGEKLTSKDIPSQATTADVLGVLVANIGKEVGNDTFEASSYSKNKNDMIGKILIPLTKLTKKYFDKEIEVECKGSLIEFYMILQEEDIEIGVIKKIK